VEDEAMRSYLIAALIAAAALLVAPPPSQAQYYYYGSRPVVAVSTPYAGVYVGVRPLRVAVSAPYTNVYVGARPVYTEVYSPAPVAVAAPVVAAPTVVYGTPYYTRREVRRAYRSGYAVVPAGGYYYYR
jgi:hypothetical protein